jgi:hypothetical protein
MASTRAQQGALLANPTFLNQITGSLLSYANSVFLEEPGTPNHMIRLKFARALLGTPLQHATILAPTYLNSPAIAAAAGDVSTIADADVDAATAAQFDIYAAFYASEQTSGVLLPFGQ